MINKQRWGFIAISILCLLNSFIASGAETGNRFVDFSLEDPQAKKYSQSDMEGKITLVVLQSRTTLQTAIDGAQQRISARSPTGVGSYQKHWNSFT